MADIPQWWMKGDWFDVCNCNIACPCEFAQPPTGGHCEGVTAYRVREGAYGDTRVDGLSLITLLQFDGDIWAGKASNIVFAQFFDDRADERQREAMQMVFGGQAGGFPAVTAELLGEPVVREFAPIRFSVADDLAEWSAEIPGRVLARAEALSGPTTPPGARVQLLNPPGSETGPGQIVTWGRAIDNRVETDLFRWSWPGQSSKHIPFDWTGPG